MKLITFGEERIFCHEMRWCINCPYLSMANIHLLPTLRSLTGMSKKSSLVSGFFTTIKKEGLPTF